MAKSTNTGSVDQQLIVKNAELEARIRQLEASTSMFRSPSGEGQDIDSPLASSSSSSSSSIVVKANSINSYWWPSAEDGIGGILAKIHAVQHPADCSSPTTKFFVWRSKRDSESDTRGLTAWGHAGASHMLHAFTDGDKFREYGKTSRVLITDEKLWPMAKGCLNGGPQTRECYFEPLTSCKLSDVDSMYINNKINNNTAKLIEVQEEYDRTKRTVYSSEKLWFRNIRRKYSWVNLPGSETDYSTLTLNAASLAYYFRPKPWLRSEIDKRIRNSIPSDLNPDRTLGVPIRRSDKCHGHNITGSAKGELDCPGLLAYLAAVRKFLEFDPLIKNVIVTSEDKSACDEFLGLMKKEFPKLRVVLNVGDVQQGTGSGSKLESYVEGAANANVVASALTSMHLHLRARYFIITSKSTWTSTISVMARVYGFASEVFVLDIGRNTNNFAELARSGCGSRILE